MARQINVFEVLDTPFNQAHNSALIGLFFMNSPSYTDVRMVKRRSDFRIYSNYVEYREKLAKQTNRKKA